MYMDIECFKIPYLVKHEVPSCWHCIEDEYEIDIQIGI